MTPRLPAAGPDAHAAGAGARSTRSRPGAGTRNLCRCATRSGPGAGTRNLCRCATRSGPGAGTRNLS